MVFFQKQKIKIILYFSCILLSIIIIYMKVKSPLIKISQSNDELTSKQMLMIHQNPLYNGDLNVYQKTKEENQFTKVNRKDMKENKENKNTNDEIKINIPDNADPNNVTDIKTTAIDDYIIINFQEAQDNGTEYEYYVETKDNKNRINSEVLNLISKSGIKGYSYIIDNYKDTQAGFEINKLNSDPILFNKLQWDKDYYLHIRAIDKNGNASSNLTYKIDLPSNGIKMQYIDINTYSEISPEESIIGNVNDEYNLKDYQKKLEDYTLIKIDGEEQGKLKKERINIKYKYAKNATIKISYIDKISNKKIKEDSYINGYEGKEYNIAIPNISGYKYNTSENIYGKMLEGNQEIKIYYDKVNSINIEFVDIYTKQKILKDEIITGIVGSNYSLEYKTIPGYKLEKVEGLMKGIIQDNDTKITCYYKKKASLHLKHIDIDTKKLLLEEKIDGYVGDRIQISSKEFEGYILNDNYEKYKKINNHNKNSNNKSEKMKKGDQNNSKDKKTIKETLINELELNNNKENIIDEILKEDLEDNKENPDKKEDIELEEVLNSVQSYDIVIRCDNDEYIIYYKKK